MPVETTQFARVMRELGIQQIFALSPQAKGRVERMLETFQERLATELRLAGASTIDEASLVLRDFLPRFNARFAVAADQPEAAYRPVPDELSLTEAICLKETRKVGRDNTVKYQWQVLQLLPGAERPSYSGLRVDVLERADRELLIRYQGEAVDYQEGPPPASALWGADTGCSPDPELQPELQEVADSAAVTHLDETQRKRLATLESSAEEAAKRAGDKWEAGPTPVASQADANPAGTLGGGAAGQAAGTFPPGHRPEPGHGQKHREEVRRGRRCTHQEAQRQGAYQGRGSGRIANGLRLTPVTYSLFKKGDGIAGQQHISPFTGLMFLYIDRRHGRHGLPSRVRRLRVDADLDLGGAGGDGWAPIGDFSASPKAPYDAVFEGNGHVIGNLYVNYGGSVNRGNGLFGHLGPNSNVRRLGLENVDVTAAGVPNVGGLVVSQG